MFLKHTPTPADAYGIMKFWNIEGGVIIAAFDDDVARAQKSTSTMSRRSLSYVISTIEASVK